MFTGIVQALARVERVSEEGGCLRLRISRPTAWKVVHGQSIMVSGVCSTVVSFGQNFFDVVYMPETLTKTTVKHLAMGSLVNLERSLTLRDPLDGHIVQGHVDGCGQVVAIEPDGDSRVVTVSIPKALIPFVAPLGSVTLNGTSLTVARRATNRVTVALIPYTLEHTNLGTLEKGDVVNVEVDTLARYVVNALKEARTKRKVQSAN